MNRFASRRSTAFLILAWALVSALAADAFNLDDLIPGTFVVHDEDDCLTVSQSTGYVKDLSIGSLYLHGVLTAGRNPGGTSAGHSPATLAIDQDSPSLASDPLGPVPLESVLCADDLVFSDESVTSSEPLHLMNCTLLI